MSRNSKSCRNIFSIVFERIYSYNYQLWPKSYLLMKKRAANVNLLNFAILITIFFHVYTFKCYGVHMFVTEHIYLKKTQISHEETL